MKQFGLNKSDKLCSPTAIDKLFSRGANSNCELPISSAIAYPLRAVWSTETENCEDPKIKFLISIPKKRLRHAVDRVKMRRRVREAYRLNRHNYPSEKNNTVNLAFIYIANELKDYQTIEKSVCKILQKLTEGEKGNTQ